MKKLGSILLVAGTCIGSGMIALPMVLAKIGLVPSALLMLFIWFIMYYSSLIHLELNLQAGRGLSLGALGRRFSGRGAEFAGALSVKLLCYSLLAVFIYGGSSVLQELMGNRYSFDQIATCYSLTVVGVLLLPIKWIDYCNRVLFAGLLAVVAIMIAGLAIKVNWSDLPLFSEQCSGCSVWAALVPVVFTSFGFQVIFHTLTNYCNRDVKMLKQAFFWGSLIPAIVYILWTCSVLGVMHHDHPAFYSKMANGKAEVGELILLLSRTAKGQLVQLLVWWISLLAIATSVIGVGVGLCDSLKGMMPNRSSFLAVVLTVLPTYLVVVLIPNAFLAALGFAGMVLTVIAILLPVYLLRKLRPSYYPELNRKTLIYLSVVVACIIMACEIFNLTSAS